MQQPNREHIGPAATRLSDVIRVTSIPLILPACLPASPFLSALIWLMETPAGRVSVLALFHLLPVTPLREAFPCLTPPPLLCLRTLKFLAASLCSVTGLPRGLMGFLQALQQRNYFLFCFLHVDNPTRLPQSFGGRKTARRGGNMKG